MTRYRPGAKTRWMSRARRRPIFWFCPSRRAIPSVVGSAESLGRAISSLTGRPSPEASIVGAQVVAAESSLRVGLEARRIGGSPACLPAGARPLDPAPLLELEEEAGPYLVAVPFLAEIVMLLDEICQRTQRIWSVEKTPLVEPMLQVLASRHPKRLELISPGDLIRRHLSARRTAEVRRTFVTFPDHHWTGEESSRQVPFFGDFHWFPVLESILLIRGVLPMLTLTAGGAENPGDLIWKEYRARMTARPVTEERARDPLEWLAARLEATMRARSSSVLSWSLVAARSVRARTNESLLDRNLVTGFLRTWRASDPMLDGRMIAELLERLDRLDSEEVAPPVEVRR